jgi:hypothetical protein
MISIFYVSVGFVGDRGSCRARRRTNPTSIPAAPSRVSWMGYRRESTGRRGKHAEVSLVMIWHLRCYAEVELSVRQYRWGCEHPIRIENLTFCWRIRSTYLLGQSPVIYGYFRGVQSVNLGTIKGIMRVAFVSILKY